MRRGLCQKWQPGSRPWGWCFSGKEVSKGAWDSSQNAGLRPFHSPPTSFPSSLCVACSLSHSLSSAKFIFSLLLPRSQDCRCTHTLPGYRDTEAGAGGLGRVALILGGGWKSVHPSTSGLMSKGLSPPLGTGSQIGTEIGEIMELRALKGARSFLKVVPWYMEG